MKVAVLLLLFAACCFAQEYVELTLDTTIAFNVVEENNYRYFILRAEDFTDKNILIFAEPFSGDVKVYASNTSPYPTATDYIWSSDNTTHSVTEFITIPANVLTSGASNVTIGVLGSAPETSFFSMTAIAASEPSTLVDGAAVTNAFEVPKYQFFKFVPGTSCTVSINLTLNTTAGEFDANLYASNIHVFPTAMAYFYKEERFGDKLLEVGVESQRPLYIGVKGHFASGTKTPVFTLTAGCKTARVTSGKPVFVAAQPNQNVQLQWPGRAGLTRGAVVFAVTTLSGNTRLYLTSNNSSFPVNRDNAMWMSLDTSLVGGVGHVIAVPVKDPRFSRGPWLLGVEAVEYSAEFMVSVYLDSVTISMELNLPYVGVATPDVKNTFYHFFYIRPDNDTSGLDVYIKVYQRYNLNVYINNGFYRPTPQSYQFKSSGADSRIMNLPASELDFTKAFYVVVEGDGEHETPYHIMVCSETGCKAKEAVLQKAGNTKRLNMKVNQ